MNRVKLDLRGLEEVATTREMRAAVRDAAEAVAGNVRARGIMVQGIPGDVPLPVKLYDDTTSGMRVNRAVTRVVLAHAAGLAAQAKSGALSKAASDAGLKLRGD